MKNISLFLLFIANIQSIYSQTELDYKEYIKLNVESLPPLDNCNNNLIYGPDIRKVNADKITGKTLTTAEHDNLLIYGEEIYLDKTQSILILEIVRCCDLRAIRKVSTIKKTSTNGVVYYDIYIYLKEGGLGTEFSDNKVTSITEFSIGVKTDETTAKNIKKAIIALAKLKGSIDVIDGDNLFGN